MRQPSPVRVSPNPPRASTAATKTAAASSPPARPSLSQRSSGSRPTSSSGSALSSLMTSTSSRLTKARGSSAHRRDSQPSPTSTTLGSPSPGRGHRASSLARRTAKHPLPAGLVPQANVNTISHLGTFSHSSPDSGGVQFKKFIGVSGSQVWTVTRTSVLLLDATSRQVEAVIEKTPSMGYFSCGALAGGHVWIGTTAGHIHVLDTKSFEEVATLSRHNAAVTSVVFQAVSGFVFSASADFTITRWRSADHAVDAVLAAHHGAVSCLCLLDGGWGALASYGDDRTLSVWSDSNTRGGGGPAAAPKQWPLADITALCGGVGTQLWLGTSSGHVLWLDCSDLSSKPRLVFDDATSENHSRHPRHQDCSQLDCSVVSTTSESSSGPVTPSAVVMLELIANCLWVATRGGSINILSVADSSRAAILVRSFRCSDRPQLAFCAQSSSLDVVWLMGAQTLEEYSLHSIISSEEAVLSQQQVRQLHAEAAESREEVSASRMQSQELQGKVEVLEEEVTRLRAALEERSQGHDQQILKDMENSRAKALKALETANLQIRQLKSALQAHEDHTEESRRIQDEAEELRQENAKLSDSVDQSRRQQQLLLDRLDSLAAERDALSVHGSLESLQQELNLLGEGAASYSSTSGSPLPPTTSNPVPTTDRSPSPHHAELEHLRSEVRALSEALELASLQVASERMMDHSAEPSPQQSIGVKEALPVAQLICSLDAQLHEAQASLQKSLRDIIRPNQHKNVQSSFLTLGAVRSQLHQFCGSHPQVGSSVRPPKQASVSGVSAPIVFSGRPSAAQEEGQAEGSPHSPEGQNGEPVPEPYFDEF